ncbi:MAG: hypothetical protein U9R08_03990 [Nanoarchaeota archaeon]|nr:hypothetical protein [Nanoarchaeota archaeon]
MRINIVRNVDAGEILKRTKSLKRKKNLNDDEVLTLEKYTQAIRAYEESGEVYFDEELVTELTLEKFRKVFTKKRLEILNQLDKISFSSIAELSRHVKRDIKNIYDDLKILEKFDLVKLNKNGKTTSPMLNVESINIEFFSR